MDTKKMVIKIDHNESMNWINLLNEKNFLEVKVCNQPILEYYLFLARHLKIEEVIVCQNEYSDSLWQYENRSREFGVNIKMEISSKREDINYFKKRNRKLLSGAKVLYLLDPVFVFYDLKNELMHEHFDILPGDACVSKTEYSFLISKDLGSINDYFYLSQNILSKYYDNYFFREFAFNQSGVFVGHKSKIENTEAIIEKSVIGGYCSISKSSLLRSGVVVGDFSQISSGNELERVVLYDSVKTNPNLYSQDKIILSDKIICPLEHKVTFVKGKKTSNFTG
jgi:NDP-sugar pyrophosphorylase family protein